MSPTPQQLVEKATVAAARAHEKQLRKDGTPYIAHPVRMALGLAANGYDAVHQAAALLHDVVEDTTVTLDDLRDLGIDEAVLKAVDGLTKRPGESYREFIERCASAGDVAVRVKIADIHDNLADQSALDPDEARFLSERYNDALEFLICNRWPE